MDNIVGKIFLTIFIIGIVIISIRWFPISPTYNVGDCYKNYNYKYDIVYFKIKEMGKYSIKVVTPPPTQVVYIFPINRLSDLTQIDCFNLFDENIQ